MRTKDNFFFKFRFKNPTYFWGDSCQLISRNFFVSICRFKKKKTFCSCFLDTMHKWIKHLKITFFPLLFGLTDHLLENICLHIPRCIVWNEYWHYINANLSKYFWQSVLMSVYRLSHFKWVSNQDNIFCLGIQSV